MILFQNTCQRGEERRGQGRRGEERSGEKERRRQLLQSQQLSEAQHTYIDSFTVSLVPVDLGAIFWVIASLRRLSLLPLTPKYEQMRYANRHCEEYSDNKRCRHFHVELQGKPVARPQAVVQEQDVARVSQKNVIYVTP